MGSISFLTVKGQAAPTANAAVIDGDYKFDRNNGPIEGHYKVVIRRVVSKADSRAAPKSAESDWESTADVADDGEYLRDITITR